MTSRLSSNAKRRVITRTVIGAIAAATMAGIQAPMAHALPSTDGPWTFTGGPGGAVITAYDAVSGGRADLVVPDLLGDQPVTAIAAGVFAGDALTGQVSMPDTITAIGEYAFNDNAIASIHLSYALVSIGVNAFSSNPWLASVVLPYPLQDVGGYAFADDTRLLSVAALGPAPTTVGTDVFDRVPAASIKVSTAATGWVSPFGGLTVTPATCVSDGAGYYSGGSGSSGDPFTVATDEQLDMVGRWIYRGCAFALTADIGLQPYIDERARGSWVPIGSTTEPFTGSFDGRGHAVTSLKVTGTNSRVGLFGQADGATIADLNVSGTVAGAAYVGGLVGWANGGVIDGVDTHVTLTSTAGAAGGLVGQALSVAVSDSSATGSVTVTSSESNIGGLVGILSGAGATVSRSFATGQVVGSRNLAGEGSNYVGGLIGQVSGAFGTTALMVSDSFATGAVSGAWQVGALIGQASAVSLARTYATGTVSPPMVSLGSTAWGGLIGQGSDSVVSVSVSYWGLVTTGYPMSAPYANNDFWSPAAGGGRSTAQMKTAATFVDAGWNFTTSSWSDAAVWGICAEANGGYPYLLSFFTSAVHPCPDPAAPSPSTPAASEVVAPVATVVQDTPAPSVQPAEQGTPVLPTLSSVAPVNRRVILGLLVKPLPPRAVVSFSIPRMFAKVCAVRNGRVVAIGQGTCGVRITAVSPKGVRTNQRVYLTAV